MKKKTLGLTLMAGAMLAGFVFIPSADAQMTPQVEAQLRAAAQAAADTEAYYGETQGIPRSMNQANIQKRYNDTYRAHANALGIPTNIPQTPAMQYPGYNGYGFNNYGYVPRYRTSGRILDYLF